MSETVTLRNAHLSATIAAKGAELQSLIPAGGAEVLWHGDPAYWASRAPNLFPLVGAVADDHLIHHGQRYPIRQHGFLRHSLCAVHEVGPQTCAFRLTDSAETRAQYPFAFVLTLRYRLIDDRLTIAFELHNPAETPLYASLGGHPAFRWPLGDAPREAHVVLFERPEPAPIRRLKGRLIDPAPIPTPVEGRLLRLRDPLFAADALIFDRLDSRAAIFGAPGGPSVEVRFPDFPHLGIWTKPGGMPYLCIEPWQGYASPDGFAGELADKPGIARLDPGETRSWRYAIHPRPDFPELGAI